MKAIVAACLFGLVLQTAYSQETALAPVAIEEATLAIITTKAGFGSALAHDHLIHADKADIKVATNPAELSETNFTAQLKVRDLIVDEPQKQKELSPRLKQLKIRSEDFSEVSDSDRKDIYEAMLDEDNLNAGTFPTITAKLISLSAASASSNLEENFQAEVEFQIHGVKKTVSMPFNITRQEGRVFAEGYTTMKFTDFDIEPVSLFFGAIRNQDEFVLYANIIGALES